MTDKRVIVWVQDFKDRPHLMLQWHDPVTGLRKSKTAGTCNPLEAEKARADLEYELNHGLHQQASAMGWERFRELFEDEYLAGRRKNTVKNYAQTFDAFEKHAGNPRLRSVTARTLSAFKAAQLGAGLAAVTVKLRLTLLQAALAWAVRQGLLADVPEFPRVTVPRKKPQPVPSEAFEKLYDKADAQTRAFLLCGWLAGLRLEEAYFLEREPTEKAPWLDPDNDRIVLPAEFVKAVEDQWVPLEPALRDVLLALPRHGKRVFHFVGNRRHNRGVPLTAGGVSDRIVELAKRAGVKLTMRSLRRAFGCRYAGKVPAQVLQKLMRHSNIRVTMDYYANVDEAAMAAVLGDRGRNSSRNKSATAANLPSPG